MDSYVCSQNIVYNQHRNHRYWLCFESASGQGFPHRVVTSSGSKSSSYPSMPMIKLKSGRLHSKKKETACVNLDPSENFRVSQLLSAISVVEFLVFGRSHFSNRTGHIALGSSRPLHLVYIVICQHCYSRSSMSVDFDF